MSRVYIFMRYQINNSSIHPVPVAMFRLPRGSATRLELLISNLGDDKAPADLDTAEVVFTVRKHKYPTGEDDIVIQKTAASGVETDPENPGHLDIILSDEDMDIASTNYWYDIRIQLSEGSIRHAAGKFVVIS